MSKLTSFLGLDYRAPAKSPALNSFIAGLQDPNYGQDQLAKTTAATVQGALPGFLGDLQGLREQNIRRGISTGDLGSSFEGDLTSAFQRNIANSVASQSANMFNQRNGLLFDALNGQLDREQAAQDNAAQRRGSLFGGLLGFGGMALGRR